jgi:NitT/TauT family transport system permease protein
VERRYVQAAQNFGVDRAAPVPHRGVPAALPQILTGMRLGLGVAWLVVVAAEMVAINSGLGYLIIDARNAGSRYDLVVAGMVLIGVIGFGLDLLMRRLESLDAVRWRYDHAR